MSVAVPGSAEGTAKGFRLQWLDYVRGMNILVVVFVHVWRGLVGSGVTAESPRVDFFLDCIAPMSLFFFISGMFISKTVDLAPREYLNLKLRDFAYPYAIWVTLHALTHAAAGGNANREFPLADLWTAIYDPPWHYWFLYTLFAVQLLYYAARRLRIAPLWFLVFMIGLYLTIDLKWIDFGPWGVFYQVRRYGLWFALGLVINRGEPVRWLSHAPTAALVPITVAGFAFAAWAVSLGARDLHATILPLALASGTAQLSLAVLLERGKMLGFITLWGRRSLEIYLAHVIFLAVVRIALQRVLGIEALPIHLILGMLAGLYVPIALAWACNRLDFNYLFSLRAR